MEENQKDFKKHSISILPYESSFSKGLEILQQSSPQGSYISLCDHGIYETRTSVFRNRSILVAINNETNEVCGAYSGIVKQIKIQNRWVKSGYGLSLRVLPFYRKQGIALQLIDEMEEWFKKNNVEMIYVHIIADNLPSKSLFIQKLCYEPIRKISSCSTPIYKNPFPLEFNICVKKLSIQESKEYLLKGFANENLWITEEDLNDIVSSDYFVGTFVATHPDLEGEASLSVYDPSYHKTILHDANPWLLRVAKLLKFCSFFLPVPANIFTTTGVEIKSRNVFGCFSCGKGGPILFQSLVKYLCNQFIGTDVFVLAFLLEENHPLMKEIPYWSILNVSVELCIKKMSSSLQVDDLSTSTFFHDPRETQLKKTKSILACFFWRNECL